MLIPFRQSFCYIQIMYLAIFRNVGVNVDGMPRSALWILVGAFT